MHVRIVVRDIGVNFGVAAAVMSEAQEELWEGRLWPHGFRSNARAEAERECEARGWNVRDPEEVSDEV